MGRKPALCKSTLALEQSGSCNQNHQIPCQLLRAMHADPQLRTVTLQVTEQALVVPGCFLGSLAVMVLVMSNMHCSRWPSSSPTAAQDNAHRAGNLACRAGSNSSLCSSPALWSRHGHAAHLCQGMCTLPACDWSICSSRTNMDGCNFVSSNYLRYVVA